MKKKIIIIPALALVLFSLIFFINKKVQKSRNSKKYNISKIFQTGEQKEVLSSLYLSQLLDLSVDKPTNYFLFDTKLANKKLLKSPLIKKANVKKNKPNAVYVDYTIRKPLFVLFDYENVAIDEDGYLFPISPFLSPKDLVKVILLNDKNSLKDSLDFFNDNSFTDLANSASKEFNLAKNIYSLFCSCSELNFKDGFKLKKIDVSKAFLENLAKQEIVISLEEHIFIKQDPVHQVRAVFPKILRLSVDDLAKQLGNYLELRKKIRQDYERQLKNSSAIEAVGANDIGASDIGSDNKVVFSQKVIDFRIDKIAFIDDI
jgi:hypothetical protein